MKCDSALQAFQGEWEAFLTERGHTLGRPEGIEVVLRSSDASGKGYRWLLVLPSGRSKTLNEAEQRDIRHHVQMAKRPRQEVYLVMRFDVPQRKVLILSAEQALKRKRILPRKGGIPWVD